VKNAIVEKLRAALDSGLDSECKVFYVIGESRKLLDKFPPDQPQFALTLYFNWALHVDLDRRNTTLPFLQRVDEFVASRLSGKAADLLLEHYLFRELVFLDSFRAQLKQLLSTHGLPTELCDDDDRWHEFITHYAGIIEDGSLTCDGKNLPLKWVRRVVFTKGRARRGSHVPFGLNWQIDLLDGSSLHVDVYAVAPKGLQMIGHVITTNPAPVENQRLISKPVTDRE
jgi:hypothetical protein